MLLILQIAQTQRVGETAVLNLQSGQHAPEYERGATDSTYKYSIVVSLVPRTLETPKRRSPSYSLPIPTTAATTTTEPTGDKIRRPNLTAPWGIYTQYQLPPCPPPKKIQALFPLNTKTQIALCISGQNCIQLHEQKVSTPHTREREGGFTLAPPALNRSRQGLTPCCGAQTRASALDLTAEGEGFPRRAPARILSRAQGVF